MTYMRAWTSLKFGKIRLLVPMATDRVIMEKNGVATFSRLFLAHLSRRLVGELIVYPCSGVRPSSVVRPSVRPSSTISNMNISATSWPITMKFYQKHHWDGGKAASGFGPDRIQTLVSMATNSSHRVIMEKTVLPLFLSCFSSDPFYTCR